MKFLYELKPVSTLLLLACDIAKDEQVLCTNLIKIYPIRYSNSRETHQH